jgi:hypothetical protein
MPSPFQSFALLIPESLTAGGRPGGEPERLTANLVRANCWPNCWQNCCKIADAVPPRKTGGPRAVSGG